MALVVLLHIFILASSCQTLFAQPNRRCDVPADVVFLMDASDSIKETEWEQEKSFVAALIDKLEVARYAIHVGVIVYSTDIGLIIDLQPFKTKSQLKDLLQKAVQINQGTDTARAISKLIEMSYNQGRLDAKQIAVVITDGRSTDVFSTMEQARRARNEFNIDMIALGVGNETFREELKEISGSGPGSTDRLFEVQNFNQLRDVEAGLEEIICEIIPPTTAPPPSTTTLTSTTPSTTSPYIPPFPCSKPADVVFLIDGSYSITAEDWVKGKQFVSYLINSLDIGPSSINVGIVVYSSAVGDVVNLRPFRSKTELRQAASGLIQPPVGRTNTALGLQTVRDMIRTQARPGVPHITIVITDGKSSNPSETRDQAISAKIEGLVIFVVGVGDKILRQEVEDMASSPETLFDAPDFRFLVGMVELLRDNICTAIQEPTTTPPTQPTTTPRPAIPDLCKECLVEGGVGFNPMPADCQKYVMCIPYGLTYDPVIKNCPFGMFWSKEAVSCLDARYVNCPYDKCKVMPEGRTYSPSSGGCRGYWQCSGRRSVAMCCEMGYRYREGLGCRSDPSCRDPCPLNATIHNEGACKYRPDPDTVYGYLEVVPGQGHIKRSCQPGQVYDDKICSCTYNAADVIPDLACTPFVNLAFNGNLQSSSRQTMEVHQVSLTNYGTAFFDGMGHLTWPGLANKDMGDKFFIHLKYRMRNDMNRNGKAWNDHWSWGFQNWFKNSSNHGSRHTVRVSNTTINTPDRGRIEKMLEIISIGRDGSVTRDPRYEVKVNASWPSGTQTKINSIQLGQLASISSPTFDNGIVYIPNGMNSILIQEPTGATSIDGTGQAWKVVTIAADSPVGRVVESGQGTVPRRIQDQYKFNLQPALTQRWFIIEPQGVVLQEGSGIIPMDVRDRYAGFMAGTLIKLFMRGGNEVERWQISRPDGSQMQEGNGALPSSVTSRFDISSYLMPSQISKVWSVVKSDGAVLESGQGDVPASIMNKYRAMQSVSIFSSSKGSGMDSFWQLMRPSGVTILEGRGSLPSGILRTIKGNLFSSKTTTVRKWTVTMPDGTVQTGTGDIPQYLKDLFVKMRRNLSGLNTMAGSRRRTETMNSAIQLTPDKLMVTVPKLQRAWTMTFPNGTKKSGTGQIPDSLMALARFQNVLAQNNARNSKSFAVSQDWSVTLPNGTVLTGQGDLPNYVNTLLKGQGQAMGSSMWESSQSTGKSRMAMRRSKRASHTGYHHVMDILANCGQRPTETPTMHLYTSSHEVSFTLKTMTVPTGITISLPVHEGMNDVTFMYDGVHLTGMANGIERKMPLTGSIRKSVAPITVGKCYLRPQNTFDGEIDKIQMYHCLP